MYDLENKVMFYGILNDLGPDALRRGKQSAQLW